MTAAEAGFIVPPDHPCLPGHFPGEPLVPAVVLIDLAAAAARQALALGPLVGITRGKFLAPVRPGETVALRFTRREGGAVSIAGTRDGAPAFILEATFTPDDSA